MKNLFISILNFNSKDQTIKCLNSIKELKTDGFSIQVVLVDNGSKEKLDLREDFLGAIPLKIIRKEENLGFAEGQNTGIRYAFGSSADYILVLNNDATLKKDAVFEMVKAADEEKNALIIVPKIYFAKGHEYHKNRYKESELGKVFWYAGGKIDWKNVIGSHRGVDEVDKGQFDKRETTEYATSCCMLLKREAIEKIGAFDKDYFLYYEDGDLSQRVIRRGYKIVYEPKAVCFHENASSSGGSGSDLQDYYISRNRMLFGLRHAPLRAKAALVKESLKLLKSGRKWQKRGIMDFYKKKFGKGSFNP